MGTNSCLKRKQNIKIHRMLGLKYNKLTLPLLQSSLTPLNFTAINGQCTNRHYSLADSLSNWNTHRVDVSRWNYEYIVASVNLPLSCLRNTCMYTATSIQWCRGDVHAIFTVDQLPPNPCMWRHIHQEYRLMMVETICCAANKLHCCMQHNHRV